MAKKLNNAKIQVVESKKPIQIGSLGKEVATPKKPQRENNMFFEGMFEVPVLGNLMLKFGHWKGNDGKQKGGDKFDLREWKEDGTFGKGIRLTREQLLELRNTLNDIDFEE
jgi:hypothetical protein